MTEEDEHNGHLAPSPAHLENLYLLMSGYRISQAIHVVAQLGIADRLKDGAQDTDALALATETHAGALYRLLRFLAAAGLFREVAPRRFALTQLGAGLRADIPGSIAPSALMLLDDPLWSAWGQLLHSVRTGETAFGHLHGMERFPYLDAHPEAAARFQAAMTSNTARSGTAIVEAYDFAGIRRLVDVAGGYGLQLATVLHAFPSMRGVLFERPASLEAARAALQSAGVATRCEVVGGDFFVSVPPGGDAYLLRQILHDWDDGRARLILENCRQAMPESGRLLVVERVVLPEEAQASSVLHFDLEMLVTVGGLERTEADFRALFAAADFRLTGVFPLHDTSQFHIFEGVPIK